MVSNISKGFVFFILTILLISSISAAFTIGNPKNSILTSYGPREKIKGWINVSFSKESTNSLLKTLTGEEIGLMNLLGTSLNSGFLYTCDPADCNSDYEEGSSSSTKSYVLENGDFVTVGFKIPPTSRLITDVSSFSIDISSDNGESITSPLEIDILNDGQAEWKAYGSSGTLGIGSYGCYYAGTLNALITTNPYCERITLPEAPAVRIGAEVTGSGSADFIMSIEEVDGGNYKECNVNTGGSTQIKCTVPDFTLETGDYFVCIRAKGLVDEERDYMIKNEDSEPCGFTGNYDGTYYTDFEIIAQTEKYSTIGTFTLDDTELENIGSDITNIEDYIMDYLYSEYDNNCSQGCIIPIKFASGASQQLNLQNIQLRYTAEVTRELSTLSDIEETPAEISSGFQKLYLDESGFYVPNTYGNHTLTITLGSNQLLSEKITVGEIPLIKSLVPEVTAIKYPTNFMVTVNWKKNITKYSWDFGDGNTQNTTKNQVTYTYDTVGDYTIKVTIFDSNGKTASKEFDVTVIPASQAVSILLEEAKYNLENIKLQIEGLSLFKQNILEQSLNIGGLEDTLVILETAIATSTTESQYETILGELIAMRIPKSLTETGTSGELLFYPDTNNIDMSIIKEVAGGDYEAGDEEQYKESVLAWQAGNVDIKLIFDEISATYTEEAEPFIKIFDITLTKTSENAGNPYLIIRNMDNLIFQGDYSEQEKDGYFYILLDEPEKDIIFSTTADVDFVTLPMFVSPSISELTLGDVFTPYEKNTKKWVTFSIITAIILLLAGGGWFLLRLWYKRKYENHLFKNRNNLYNLMNFIEIEKKKGLKEREIGTKLRKAGWTSEQTRYALRKHANKRII